MQPSRQTTLILVFATLLSVTSLSITLARPAPPTEEQKNLARQKLALELQLTDMQMKYAESNPRIKALKEQIARYDRLITPQAEIKVKPYILHRLRARRADLRSQLLDAQLTLTDIHPRVRTLKEQLRQTDQQIADLQSKHR